MKRTGNESDPSKRKSGLKCHQFTNKTNNYHMKVDVFVNLNLGHNSQLQLCVLKRSIIGFEIKLGSSHFDCFRKSVKTMLFTQQYGC